MRFTLLWKLITSNNSIESCKIYKNYVVGVDSIWSGFNIVLICVAILIASRWKKDNLQIEYIWDSSVSTSLIWLIWNKIGLKFPSYLKYLRSLLEILLWYIYEFKIFIYTLEYISIIGGYHNQEKTFVI